MAFREAGISALIAGAPTEAYLGSDSGFPWLEIVGICLALWFTSSVVVGGLWALCGLTLGRTVTRETLGSRGSFWDPTRRS